MKLKSLVSAASIVGLVLTVSAAYNVRQPSDDIKPEWSAVNKGKWTLNVEGALSAAQAEGCFTILFNTGSWWCPFCETLEEKVLCSQIWKDYVEENGFYLAMLDFPYRGQVKDEELDKSYHPEFGNGWGFKCWLMNPEYLAENGLTERQGLEAIMAEYEIQKRLGENTTGSLTTITNCLTGEAFTYRKVGYPTLIVYGADGTELGRTSFPWYDPSLVSDEEAQQTIINSIDLLIKGVCTVCTDPEVGVPPSGESQKYSGYLETDSGICGMAEFKVGKPTSRGTSTVSGSLVLRGKKVALKQQRVSNFDEHVEFEGKLNGKKVSVWVKFGELGLSGEITDFGAPCCEEGAPAPIYAISGGRNLFGKHDEKAVTLSADAPKGTWSVVLKPSDSVSPSSFARGYGSLTVEVRSKGKAKISGTLGDGTKVNVSSQLIVGDTGMSCLPVLAPLYGKKGGFGFVIWFQNGKLLCFQDVAPWVCADRSHPFTAAYVPLATASKGPGELSDATEMELTISNFDGEVLGLPVADDPTSDEIELVKSGLNYRLYGTSVTSFSASCNKSSGLLKGKMKFRVTRPNGKTKTVSGSFTGCMMGGSGYGTVLVKRDGTWPVKIAVCGGCSD